MKHASLTTLTAACALFVVGTPAAEPNVQGFKAWSLPGYTLLAQNERQAEKLAWHFAVSTEVVPRLLPFERTPDGLPLTIIVTRDSWLEGHLPEYHYAGALTTWERFASYIVFDAALDNDDLRFVAHEIYPQYLLHSQYAFEFPAWFSTGFGYFMRDIRLGSKVATVKLIQDDDPRTGLPVGRLLRMDWAGANDRDSKTAAFHWQSMMFVHRGLAGDATFGKQMFAYLVSRHDGVDVDEAVRTAFGKSMDGLNADLRGYGHREWYRDAEVPYSRPREIGLGAGRGVAESEVLEILARTMAARGRAGPFEAVLAELQARDPNHPQLQELRIRRAVSTGDKSAFERALREVDAKAASAPAMARAAGVALCELIDDGATDSSSRERAFEWLKTSEHAQPTDAAAAWAFGLLAAKLGRDDEYEFALQRLQQATVMMPTNAELARAQALVLERLGRDEEMRGQLERMLRYSRLTRQRTWARQKLEHLRASAEASR